MEWWEGLDGGVGEVRTWKKSEKRRMPRRLILSARTSKSFPVFVEGKGKRRREGVGQLGRKQLTRTGVLRSCEYLLVFFQSEANDKLNLNGVRTAELALCIDEKVGGLL